MSSYYSQPPPTQEQLKNADACLQEYTLYMVSDNWLDEDLQEIMNSVHDLPQLSMEEQDADIEAQFREYEAEYEYNNNNDDNNNNEDNDDDDNVDDTVDDEESFHSLMMRDEDEPWDHWGEENNVDDDNQNILGEKGRYTTRCKYRYRYKYKYILCRLQIMILLVYDPTVCSRFCFCFYFFIF